ncbi:MAG: methyltransferase [Bacteroidia bacterium]|nr:methyltransferase [Bacteroidia bacterium]
MSNAFHFKQFTIEQDRCAMKVGTDGVLLGCFVKELTEPGKVLDIGSGTGLLALMMAQQFKQAAMVAIEIDADAAKQAEGNFNNSPWYERFIISHQSFQQFYSEATEPFDLIICNPPYFKEANRSKGNNDQHPDSKRAKARFANYLPFDELLQGVTQLLTGDGSFYVVLPMQEASAFKLLAEEAGLHLNALMEVTGREGATPNRWLMRWGKMEQPFQKESLLMYHHNTRPTDEYMAFTCDFYLWKKYDDHPLLKW